MNNPTNYIHSYCHIKNDKIILDNSAITINNSDTVFLKSLYNHLKLDYPKFFKMDNLCKLALLTSEILITNSKIEFDLENTNIVISNSSSTLDTDLKHQDSIQNRADFFPSPAIFVYTLPNILIGEICIKHGMKGENTFFISEKFDSNTIANYSNILQKEPKNQHTIAGWAEYTETTMDCFFYIVSKAKTGLSIEHTPEMVNQLYHS